MVLLEFNVTAAPATFAVTPAPVLMPMLPGVLFFAVAVATGVLITLVIDKSSASAGVATPASRRQMTDLRFTVPLTKLEFRLNFPNWGTLARERATWLRMRQA
jgi:hypothetical protein